jgi:SpoVK/Ycf46/Vps4 family AAA+-type ATPase
MINITDFERVVEALLSNNKVEAMRVIELEIDAEKSKGHHKIVTRLRSLLRTIADNSATGGYVAAGYRNTAQANIPTTNRLYDTSAPRTDLSSVILSRDNQRAVTEFLEEWTHKESLLKHGLMPANRMLFYGAPGTGKTKLANALATSLGYPMISVFLDELISSYLGRTGKNIREVFELASRGNVIIFLDEIDAIAKHRGDVQDTGELKRAVTVFLQNIDRLPADSIVIGATNHEELLDKAIWRRFPIRLNLDLPDLEARSRLYELFLGDEAQNISVELLSKLSEGCSGSAIEDIARNMLKYAVISNVELTNAEAVRITMAYNNDNVIKSAKTHWKKEVYEAAQYLKDEGYSHREIEALSGVPYTTLKEHVK